MILVTHHTQEFARVPEFADRGLGGLSGFSRPPRRVALPLPAARRGVDPLGERCVGKCGGAALGRRGAIQGRALPWPAPRGGGSGPRSPPAAGSGREEARLSDRGNFFADGAESGTAGSALEDMQGRNGEFRRRGNQGAYPQSTGSGLSNHTDF